MNVIVDGLLVNYERSGKGKVVVLLHGWGDTLKTFDLITQKLTGTFDVVRLDLPGFGGSQQPAGAWGLEEYGRFVAEFLRKIEVSNIYALIGHSNGGAIAIKAVAGGYLVTERLVLVGSAGIRARERGRKLAWKAVAKVGKVMTVVLPGATRAKLRSKLYKGIGSDLLVVPSMQETFKKVVNEDVQSEAMLLALPTLILNGSEDTSTPVTYAEIFHRAIAGSHLSIIEGAGHFVHQERSDDVLSQIKDFLK